MPTVRSSEPKVIAVARFLSASVGHRNAEDFLIASIAKTWKGRFAYLLWEESVNLSMTKLQGHLGKVIVTGSPSGKKSHEPLLTFLSRSIFPAARPLFISGENPIEKFPELAVREYVWIEPDHSLRYWATNGPNQITSRAVACERHYEEAKTREDIQDCLERRVIPLFHESLDPSLEFAPENHPCRTFKTLEALEAYYGTGISDVYHTLARLEEHRVLMGSLAPRAMVTTLAATRIRNYAFDRR